MAVGRRGNEPSPSISPLDHAPCDKPSMAIGWKSRSDARKPRSNDVDARYLEADFDVCAHLGEAG